MVQIIYYGIKFALKETINKYVKLKKDVAFEEFFAFDIYFVGRFGAASSKSYYSSVI